MCVYKDPKMASAKRHASDFHLSRAVEHEIRAAEKSALMNQWRGSAPCNPVGLVVQNLRQQDPNGFVRSC